MRRLKLAIIAAFILFLVQASMAATVHGTIYDDSLVQLKGVVLEIDTEPKQTLVSIDGTYSFTVPKGSYTLTAQYLEHADVKLYAKEKVSVEKEGDFVIDLLLFPPLEDEGLLNGEEISAGETGLEESNYRIIYVAVGAIILLAVSITLVIASKKKKSIPAEESKAENGDELDKLVDAIKSEGGRATQKELRKKFPMSEAKISLMIAELEHKGKITKIKKGRGNIIILNK